MVPIRPILSALLRNRTGAVLVAIQIAIALAILVNAVYIVKQRADKIGRPTGADTNNILVVSSSGFTRDYDTVGAIRDDLAYIRGVRGVIAATAINSVPLSSAGSSRTLANHPSGSFTDGENGQYFEIDEQGIDALGLHIIAGRNFRAEEIQPPIDKTSTARFESKIVVTKAMADALYPGQNAVGKPVYDQLRHPATIIGIVDRMQAAWPDYTHIGSVYFLPRLPFSYYDSMFYIVRAQPGQRDAVARTMEEHLSASNPNRIIDWIRPLQSFKERSYSTDKNTEYFLVSVTAILVAISMLGIFGLATFNVSTRTKQIGTRRAVGARRGDIVRYFMVENAMITSAGIAVGCALALGVGYYLSLQYKLPRLDLYYLVGGIPVLWTIGQLAVLQPARKASSVSPSVATRTV
ncbi:MAG: FtsX-like permease family protein [Proteobacteria bacterium]|nr:FtsX-like permease family protein [Pseudomonadota bacterium]